MDGILVVSDLHCGSIYGLLPPGFKTSDGKIMQLNPGQKYLWKCWEHMIRQVEKLPISAVVVNGDVIDGTQRAQRGTELALPMIEDQSHAAYLALKRIQERLPGRPFYMVAGTEYHDAKAAREVEVVGRALGSVQYVGAGTGRYCREVLDLDVGGVVLNFSHGISVSGGLYRATSPDREGVWSALAGKEGKVPRADCVVRSHAHYFVHVEHESKHIVITPCWQLQTRYMRKNSAYRMLPSIGAVVVHVCPNSKKVGLDPIRVQKILYHLPSVRPTKITRIEK